MPRVPAAPGHRRESVEPAPLRFWEPVLAGDEARFIQRALDANYLNDGDLTTEFEQALAQRLGTRHCVAVTSGTAALFAALAGLGVGPGDEVIVPDVTFIATAHAVSWAGATPVLVDVDPGHLTLDPEAVRGAITPRTRAILPVHVSGRAADLPALLGIAHEYGLFVIEDAAEALGSRRWGRHLATHGQAGCVSFSPNKTISTGQGGAIFTNDDALYTRLREIKDQGRAERGSGGDDTHLRVGFNLKFTNLQAAVGLAQLAHLDERLEHLRQTYVRYDHGLRGVPDLRLPGFDCPGGEVPQWIDIVSPKRDGLDHFLRARGICSRRFWHPLHTQVAYRRPDDEFPVSKRLAPRAMWLPSALMLGDADIDRVCDAAWEFLDGRSQKPRGGAVKRRPKVVDRHDAGPAPVPSAAGSAATGGAS